MSDIPDQIAMWDRKHGQNEHEAFRSEPSDFARFALESIGSRSNVLELGCGVGVDANFFANHGCTVTATDASSVVIDQNKSRFMTTGLRFEVVDVAGTLPFNDGQFDALYSHLVLHALAPTQLQVTIREMHRVTSSRGLLIFDCKSVQDSRFGQGKEVEPHFFVSPKGHARNFFSQEYVRELLDGLFEVTYMDQIDSTEYAETTNVVRCIARKSDI